jgi:hypothetical protein
MYREACMRRRTLRRLQRRESRHCVQWLSFSMRFRWLDAGNVTKLSLSNVLDTGRLTKYKRELAESFSKRAVTSRECSPGCDPVDSHCGPCTPWTSCKPRQQSSVTLDGVLECELTEGSSERAGAFGNCAPVDPHCGPCTPWAPPCSPKTQCGPTVCGQLKS